MPSVQSVIKFARGLAYVSPSQYLDADALEDFNNVYHDLENDVVRYVDEDYYYDVQYADIIANQVEYVLPLTTSSIQGFKKIQDISIKYINDGYNVYSYDAVTKTVVLTVSYTGLMAGQTVTFVNKNGYVIGTDVVATTPIPGLEFTLVTGITNLDVNSVLQIRQGVDYFKMTNMATANMSLDENRYRNNQSQYNPFYKISDYSIWIYPVSDQYVANGLKIYTIKDQIDVVLSGTESDIKIPRQYHNIIAYGMLPRIFQRRGQEAKSQAADVKFDKMRDEMIHELSNRNISPVSSSLPPLKNLE